MASKEKKLEDLKRDFIQKLQTLQRKIDEICVAVSQKEESDKIYLSSAKVLLDEGKA